MPAVKAGDRIALHYRAHGPGGALVASTEGGPPMQMIAGGDTVIRGLSMAVIGMSVGEQKTLRLSPGEAFGEGSVAVERSIERSKLPEDLAVGDVVRLSIGSMSALLWMVELRDDDTWRVSTEHPLCGSALDITLALVAVHNGPPSGA